jgi:hypothetical protein
MNCYYIVFHDEVTSKYDIALKKTYCGCRLKKGELLRVLMWYLSCFLVRGVTQNTRNIQNPENGVVAVYVPAFWKLGQLLRILTNIRVQWILLLPVTCLNPGI